MFDLGQDVNVVVLSITEGEGVPLEYPTLFHKADLVLVTKIDLLPMLPDVSLDVIEGNLTCVMPVPRVICVSARTGEGCDRWMRWLTERRHHGVDERHAAVAGGVRA